MTFLVDRRTATSLVFRWTIPLGLLLGNLSDLLVTGSSSRLWAQPKMLQPLAGRAPKSPGAATHLSGVFLPTDRTSVRKFETAGQLLEEKRFSEAVQLLDSILAAETDWFFPSLDDRSRFHSLKSQANQLLAQLPPRGQELYELKFGIAAKKMMQTAVKSGDAAAVAKVSQRFFYTEAGREAVAWLGLFYLDRGQPLAAALCFEQLVNAPALKHPWATPASLTAALCWFRAGQPERASQMLQTFRVNHASETVEIAGQHVRLFEDPSESLPWLARICGEPMSDMPPVMDRWEMFRGNPTRHQTAVGGMPLMRSRWRVRTANHPSIEQVLQQRLQWYVSNNVVALCAFHPLAVDDVLLTRTARHLLAIDLETGKRLWEVPVDLDHQFDDLVKASRTQVRTGKVSQLAIGLEQRMWDDATYGTLTTDGERVFAIQELGLTSTRQLWGRGIRPQRELLGAEKKPSNCLDAYDLAHAGRRVWRLGGSQSDGPELSDAFFLGAPLVLADELYVLAEINSGIQLVVLNAKTGQLLWTQQLADLEQSVDKDRFRRLAGATPSFADGILVCPTSAGAAVAVDLTKRSLRWAYKYPHSYYSRSNQMAMLMLHGHAPGQLRPNERWLDATVTIVDDRALLTPVESGKIHCLNLHNGSIHWTADRDDHLYVACVHEGKVILVGQTNVTALAIADGTLIWQSSPRSTSANSRPSGRGFHSGDYYYLPLTSAEIVKIDLQNGQVVQRVRSRRGEVPGNLICHRQHVISQSVDFLDAFFQLDPLKKRVEQTLEQNPDDAEALARRGEIELNEGNLQEATAYFHRSYDLDPNEMTRELLVESLFESLRRDSVAHQETIGQLETIIDREEQRLELLRLVAAGHQKSGRLLEAFDTYMQLVDLDTTTTSLLAINPVLSARPGRLIQAQLVSLRESANPQQRGSICADIEACKASLGEVPSAQQLRNFLNYFGDDSNAEEVRLRLASALLQTGDLLECELLALRLKEAPDARHRHAATALLAETLRQAGRWEQARDFYQQLNGPLRDVICLAGKMGGQIVAELSPEDPLRTALQAPFTWPSGRVHVLRLPSRSKTANRQPTTTVPLKGNLEPFFGDTVVSVDQRRRTLEGHDGHGKEWFHIPLNPPQEPWQGLVINRNGNHGAACGHLLVISTGYQVLALDTLRTRGDAWNRVLWRKDLSEQIPGLRSGHLVRFQRVQVRGGLPRQQAIDRKRRPVGILGPVNCQGVVFQQFGDLLCVEPLTGEPLWIRHNVPSGSDLFGDNEYLFVVPPGRKESWVLRMLDGQWLGTREVPSTKKRMTTVGRRVLHWNVTKGQLQLTLSDPWTNHDVWAKQFGAEQQTKVWLVDNDAIAVMEESGKFVILNLADGQAIVDQQLKPEPNLVGIYVIPSRDQYLLLTNSSPRGSPSRRVAQRKFLSETIRSVSGKLYAFDRATGQLQWPQPATVVKQTISLSQPRELPVLAFSRQFNNGKAGSQHTSVICLDKRTGAGLVEEPDPGRFAGYPIALSAETDNHSVVLSLPSAKVVMKFTDEPTVPEPPFQADKTEPKSSGKGPVTIDPGILSWVLDSLSAGFKDRGDAPVEKSKLEQELAAKPDPTPSVTAPNGLRADPP